MPLSELHGNSDKILTMLVEKNFKYFYWKAQSNFNTIENFHENSLEKNLKKQHTHMNFGIFINFTPEFSIWPIFESAFFDIFSAQISAKIDFLLQKIAFSHYRIESVTFQMNQNNKKFPISKAKCFKRRKFCPFYELKCEKKHMFQCLKT